LPGDSGGFVIGPTTTDPARENLVLILKKLLDSDLDLGFLMQLNERSLEQLIVAVRMRMERGIG
jgi:hypothetical protein